MSKVILAYDWEGPEGYWPNGQSLDFLLNPKKFAKSNYAVNNPRNPYDLEKRRHLFTYEKLLPILSRLGIGYEQMPISRVGDRKFLYVMTPLLKPYQWVEQAFDHVSETALEAQRNYQALFVINDELEGYSNREFNFFEHLHKQISEYNLRAENILYLSMNSRISDEYDKWADQQGIAHRVLMQTVYVFEGYEFYNPTLAVAKKTKHFICLNRQPRPQRQALVYELWRRNLLQYGIVSMPSVENSGDEVFDKAHAEHFGLDVSRWDEFLAALPFVADDIDLTTQDCSRPVSMYEQAVFSLITEQDYDPDCIKFSEKTFQSICFGAIPIYFGSPGTISELEKLGYTSIPSEYDGIYHTSNRFKAVVDLIEQLCQKPIDQLIDQTNGIMNTNLQHVKYRTDNWPILNRFKGIQGWLHD